MEEENESFFLDLSLTKDHAYVTIASNSKTTSEVHVLDASDINARPQCIRKRKEGVSYFIDHARTEFIIVSNDDGAINYKVSTMSNLKENVWYDWIPSCSGKFSN